MLLELALSGCTTHPDVFQRPAETCLLMSFEVRDEDQMN
jgi:starvation-inducible outer membrane lipoprotein